MIRFVYNSLNDTLGIDPNSNFIRQLSAYKSGKRDPWREWENDILVTIALKGSSIAALCLANNPTPLHVFYQDPEFHVKAYHYTRTINHIGWYLGKRTLALSLSMNESSLHFRFLDSGIQPRRTPITAEKVYGNELSLNVTWRDEQGRIISASFSGLHSRWYLSNGEVQDAGTVSKQRGDGRD
jgi:hypothetical protein